MSPSLISRPGARGRASAGRGSRRRSGCRRGSCAGAIGATAAAASSPSSAERLPDGDVDGLRQPQPRERALGRLVDLAHHPAARRDDPARAALADAAARALGLDVECSVCGNDRSKRTATTSGSFATRRLMSARWTRDQAAPELRLRAPRRTSALIRGEPPRDVDRADGEDRGLARGRVGADGERARRPRRSRSTADAGDADARARAGARRELARFSLPPGAVRRGRPFPYSGGSSSGPRNRTSCSSSTPKPLVHAAPRLGHQRDRVRARRAAGVLDEVRVPLARSTAPPIRWPFSPHASISAPGPGPVARVLEDAAERPLVGRLRRLALREQLGDLGLDRLGGCGSSRKRTWATTSPGASPEWRYERSSSSAAERARAPAADDDRVDEHGAPVAPVGAGVHPHAAAGRARDRRGELEAAEPRVARAMQADGVRRAAACDEQLAVDLDRCELPGELEHERVEAVVVRRAGSSRARWPRPRASSLGAQREQPRRARRASRAGRASAPGRRCRSS